MLSYLIKTTEALLMTAVLLGVTVGYLRLTGDRLMARIVGTGIAAGTIASIVMSVLKNTTSKVDTGSWNLWNFGISLGAFAVFLLASLGPLPKKWPKVFRPAASVALAVICGLAILYALPDVWAYLYQDSLVKTTLVSTDYLYKVIGYVFGILLNVVVFLAVCACTGKLTEGGALCLLCAELVVRSLRQVTMIFSILLAKRIVTNNHTMFQVAKFASNHSDWFLYATMLLAAGVAVLLWVRSFRVNEPYRNPAEHRKIRARWRHIRQWASCALIAFFLCVMNMTVVSAMSTKKVELSPIEPATRVTDTEVTVAFELVEDGHLHRFAYETENGTEIRFIVIKKPNSSSYGIGLDACDICGETGYYEKDGQVVCKLCDVVMNINTIGFKGGCNPIVIDYEIHDGEIHVPIAGLLEYEKEFK